MTGTDCWQLVARDPRERILNDIALQAALALVHTCAYSAPAARGIADLRTPVGRRFKDLRDARVHDAALHPLDVRPHPLTRYRARNEYQTCPSCLAIMRPPAAAFSMVSVSSRGGMPRSLLRGTGRVAGWRLPAGDDPSPPVPQRRTASALMRSRKGSRSALASRAASARTASEACVRAIVCSSASSEARRLTIAARASPRAWTACGRSASSSRTNASSAWSSGEFAPALARRVVSRATRRSTCAGSDEEGRRSDGAVTTVTTPVARRHASNASSTSASQNVMCTGRRRGPLA